MRYGEKCEYKTIKNGEYEFEEVEKFKYLGMVIVSDGESRTEMVERIAATNRAFYANKKLLKTRV